jgi:hypothetical protein
MEGQGYRPATYSVLGTASRRSPLLLLSDDPGAFGLSCRGSWSVVQLLVDEHSVGEVVASEAGYGDHPEDALFHAALNLTRHRASLGESSAEAVLLLESASTMSAEDLADLSTEAGMNALRRLIDSIAAVGTPPETVISALMDEYIEGPDNDLEPRRDV